MNYGGRRIVLTQLNPKKLDLLSVSFYVDHILNAVSTV